MNAYIINGTECIAAHSMGAALKAFSQVESIEDVDDVYKATSKQLNLKVKTLDENDNVVRSDKLSDIIKHMADGEVRYIYGDL